MPHLPQLLQKTGQIDRTIDREFTDEEAKYRMCDYFDDYLPQFSTNSTTLIFSFEKECQALQKDSKGYWDAMRGKISIIALFVYSRSNQG